MAGAVIDQTAEQQVLLGCWQGSMANNKLSVRALLGRARIGSVLTAQFHSEECLRVDGGWPRGCFDNADGRWLCVFFGGGLAHCAALKERGADINRLPGKERGIDQGVSGGGGSEWVLVKGPTPTHQ